MQTRRWNKNFTSGSKLGIRPRLIKLNRAADAKKALEKVIETDSSNGDANRELGVIYYNDKQFDKAIPLLKKSYATQPDANVAFGLGKAYMENRATRNPQSSFSKRRSIKIHRCMKPILTLPRAYYKKEKFLAAATEYEKIRP